MRLIQKKIFLLALSFLLLASPVFAVDYTKDVNCIAAWLLDVNEDPLSDSSGNGNTSDIISNSLFEFLASAKYDGGFYLHGGYALTADMAGVTDYPHSIGSWVNADNNHDGITIGASYRDDSSNHWNLVGVRNESGQGALIARTDEAGYGRIDGSTDVCDGTWHHVAGLFISDTSKKLYVNGVQEGETLTTNLNFDPMQYWTMGALYDSTWARDSLV